MSPDAVWCHACQKPLAARAYVRFAFAVNRLQPRSGPTRGGANVIWRVQGRVSGAPARPTMVGPRGENFAILDLKMSNLYNVFSTCQGSIRHLNRDRQILVQVVSNRGFPYG